MAQAQSRCNTLDKTKKKLEADMADLTADLEKSNRKIDKTCIIFILNYLYQHLYLSFLLKTCCLVEYFCRPRKYSTVG